MTRRGGTLALAASLAVFCLCASLVGWRLMAHRPATGPEPTKVASAPASARGQGAARRQTLDHHRPSRRSGAGAARRGLGAARAAPRRAEQARRERAETRGPAYYVSAALVSTDGGYMGKFPEAGQEADALAERLAMNSAQMAGAGDAAQMDAGADDDGGADTPDDAQDLMLTSANSNQLEVVAGGADGRPRLKQTILKTVVAEKIGDLLIANGFAEDSARAVEARGQGGVQRADPAGAKRRPRGRRARRGGRLSRDPTRDLREQRLRRRDRSGRERPLWRRRPADDSPGASRRFRQDGRRRRAFRPRRRRLQRRLAQRDARTGDPRGDPAPRPPRRSQVSAAGRRNRSRDFRARLSRQVEILGQDRLCRLARRRRRRGRLLFLRSGRRRVPLFRSQRPPPSPRPARRRRASATAAPPASAAFSRRSRALR